MITNQIRCINISKYKYLYIQKKNYKKKIEITVTLIKYMWKGKIHMGKYGKNSSKDKLY